MGRTRESSTSSVEEQLHKVAKKPGKGVWLPSQSKHIIENVRQFFEKEHFSR